MRAYDSYAVLRHTAHNRVIMSPAGLEPSPTRQRRIGIRKTNFATDSAIPALIYLKLLLQPFVVQDVPSSYLKGPYLKLFGLL